MRCYLLAGGSIEVRSQSAKLDVRSALERCHSRFSTDVSTATQWRQLADGNTISGDDERLTLIKPPHNVAAAITQLTLGYFGGHDSSVALVLRSPTRIAACLGSAEKRQLRVHRSVV